MTDQIDPHPLQTALLNEKETAILLGLKVATLRRWRWAGSGPRFLKVGGAIRYDPVDIAAYRKACRRSSTSDPGPEVRGYG